MKNLKGGYQLVDLEKNDLSSSFTLEGLYQTITLSNNKSLLVTGIVIGGTKKNDVYTTATVSGTSYQFEVYGKVITVEEDDDVTVSDKESETTLYYHKAIFGNLELYYINSVSTKGAFIYAEGQLRYRPKGKDDTSEQITIKEFIMGCKYPASIKISGSYQGTNYKIVEAHYSSPNIVWGGIYESCASDTYSATAKEFSTSISTPIVDSEVKKL